MIAHVAHPPLRRTGYQGAPSAEGKPRCLDSIQHSSHKATRFVPGGRRPRPRATHTRKERHGLKPHRRTAACFTSHKRGLRNMPRASCVAETGRIQWSYCRMAGETKHDGSLRACVHACLRSLLPRWDGWNCSGCSKWGWNQHLGILCASRKFISVNDHQQQQQVLGPLRHDISMVVPCLTLWWLRPHLHIVGEII